MFQVQVDESEDTEWNDILRSRGIIPEKPPSPTEELEELVSEARDRVWEHRLSDVSLSGLEELEDDEDEEFLEQYRQKRVREMAELRKRSKFGEIFHVTKPEYAKEVTEASRESFVACHLTLQSSLQSRLLSHLCQKVAKKYPEVKFVEIPANRAIENYPDSNCPTLLIYKDGEVRKNLVTLLELGGDRTTLRDVEALLAYLGAIKLQDEEEFDD